MLTTKSADEANAVGDRIVMLVGGRIHCSGTVQFLKDRYEKKFLMEVVLKVTYQEN